MSLLQQFYALTCYTVIFAALKRYVLAQKQVVNHRLIFRLVQNFSQIGRSVADCPPFWTDKKLSYCWRCVWCLHKWPAVSIEHLSSYVLAMKPVVPLSHSAGDSN